MNVAVRIVFLDVTASWFLEPLYGRLQKAMQCFMFLVYYDPTIVIWKVAVVIDKNVLLNIFVERDCFDTHMLKDSTIGKTSQ